MERYVFIHGSSVGQSSYIPSNAPQSVCSEIADSYFKGRELRCKESEAGMALFVELCKNAQGGGFVCYSFVNNKCEGFPTNDGKGRAGQYIAISILCQDYYFPEPIYNLFQSAYKQLFEGRIIDKDGRFLVRQFDEKKEELQKGIEQIDKYFGEFSQNKRLKPGFQPADYLSWKGEKLSLDICNSEVAFETLCKHGRIYVSSEYESPSAKIQLLENNNNTLQHRIDELEKEISNANSANRIKSNKELEDVRRTLKEEEGKSKRLQADNEKYKESLKVVKNELEKYGKLGESIHGIQNQHSNYGKKDKKDLLRVILLFVVLVITLISSILNYAFFRNISSDFEEIKTKITEVGAVQNTPELKNEVTPQMPPAGETERPIEAPRTLSLSVSKLDFEAAGGTKEVVVTASDAWEFEKTNVPNWLTLTQKGDKLTVKAKANSGVQRTYTFMVRAGNLEKQVNITQKEKEVVKTEKPDFGLVVKDSQGNVLKQGSKVTKGQILTASVSKPSFADNIGWTYSGCTGKGDNLKDVNVTITAESGSAAIEYGPKNDKSKRQIISFEIEPKTDAAPTDKETPEAKTSNTEVTADSANNK